MNQRLTFVLFALAVTPVGVLAATSWNHGGGAGPAIGADVKVSALPDLHRWGRVGTVSSFNLGTTVCNIGDEIIPWVASTNHHPAIINNLYRLKDGRFEQVGMGWVKHGFFSTNSDGCGTCQDPGSGSLLGLGCSDTYSAILNGDQSRLGPRSDVNAFTGVFPYPPTLNSGTGRLSGRVQIQDGDLDPGLNPGAKYFFEGHYVVLEDAQDGNGDNNASHRRVRVTGTAPNWTLDFDGQPVQQRPALEAWRDNDPSVVITELRVPGEGRFLLGYNAYDNGDGTWSYEYALYNQNSDRSARGFAVPVPSGASVTSPGFHDVDYHSGEVYDGADWQYKLARGHAAWFTSAYAANPDANALRWGTIYNFRVTCDRPPGPSVLQVGLFKPGTPKRLTVAAIGPN
ncbi:MAG: hypothetical protein EYC70_13030 [Planctomycetota bacterium]|nr:MAG: hypothetical protein EYC70_13030 [Planctomycetota bacterium]